MPEKKCNRRAAFMLSEVALPNSMVMRTMLLKSPSSTH